MEIEQIENNYSPTRDGQTAGSGKWMIAAALAETTSAGGGTYRYDGNAVAGTGFFHGSPWKRG